MVVTELTTELKDCFDRKCPTEYDRLAHQLGLLYDVTKKPR